MSDTIAAARRFTRIRAGISIRKIAVIACLAMIESAITAALNQTPVRTAVAKFSVGIITLFKTRVFGLDIAAANAIAADRLLALRRARILGVGVTIITGLFTLPNDPIPATRHGTIAQAGVGIDDVPVITLLTVLHCSITAPSRLTAIAVISGILIPIITALTRTDDPITAASL
jgi:hypothetical protein